MAVTLVEKKQSYIVRLRQASATILDALAQAENAKQGLIDSGFASGGNALTDADVQAHNPDLTASDILAAVTAINTIDTALAASARTGYTALEKARSL